MSLLQKLTITLFVLLLSTIGTLIYTIAVIETKLDLSLERCSELHNDFERHRDDHT